MRVAITGVSGLLGSHLAAAFARNADVIGLDRHDWWGDVPVEIHKGELTDDAYVASVLRRPDIDVLIHCAAMLNVDGCESDPASAYALNADLTRDLALSGSPARLFIYITTDGIFPGDRPFSSETALPCPRTVYGRSKLHGEWNVQLATPNHLIVRTNFFGWASGRKLSSAEWLYDALERGEALTLFDDFFFTPVYVGILAEQIRALAMSSFRGVINVVGADRVSKLEFGIRLAAAAGLSTENVRRGSIDEARLAAPRPKDMSLSSEVFTKVTGMPATSCDKSIERFLADRRRPLSARIGTSASV